MDFGFYNYEGPFITAAISKCVSTFLYRCFRNCLKKINKAYCYFSKFSSKDRLSNIKET